MKSQYQMWKEAEARSAEANKLFLELVKNGDITNEELARLIEKHPGRWGRFQGWLGKLPSENANYKPMFLMFNGSIYRPCRILPNIPETFENGVTFASQEEATCFAEHFLRMNAPWAESYRIDTTHDAVTHTLKGDILSAIQHLPKVG